MFNDLHVHNIVNLIKITINLVHAYNEALKHIQYPIIYENLSLFQNQHQEHISILKCLIAKYGKIPVGFKQDFKTSDMKQSTPLEKIEDTISALKAMEINEEINIKEYFQVLSDTDMPDEAKKILRENYQVERIHLEYIRNTIRSISETE